MRGLRFGVLVPALAFFSGCTAATHVTSDPVHCEAAAGPDHRVLNDPLAATGLGQVLVTTARPTTLNLDSPIGSDACNARRFTAIGRDQALTSGYAREYFAVWGNGTRGRYTNDGHFHMDDPPIPTLSNQQFCDSWILVNVPHDRDDLSRWGLGRWPWVMGARVNGGVDGFSVDDQLIVHRRRSRSGTTTRLFVQGTSTQPATGKYLLATTNIVESFLETEYLRINPLGVADKKELSELAKDDPDVAVQIEVIRQIAKWLRMTP